MDLILAFSLQDQVEKYGAYVGLAAFLGLAVLSLLYFAQARELKRLRDWAGRAPERALELEARVVAQAEEALREAEAGAAPAAAASGNGGQVAAPAAVPMGPRPAVAVAAAAERAQATVEAPVVPASADGDGAPQDDERAGDDQAAQGEGLPAGGVPAAAAAGVIAGDRAAVADDESAAAGDERGAADGESAVAGDDRPVAEDAPAVAGDERGAADGESAVAGDERGVADDAPSVAGDDRGVADDAPSVAGDDRPVAEDESVVAGDDRAVAEDESVVAGDDRAAADDEPAAAGEERGPVADDEAAAASDEDRVEPDEDRAPAPTGWGAGDEPEDERSGNGVPAAPPTQIPRATPRPQPRPAAAAAPLRTSTPSRTVTPPPPRRTATGRPAREGGSRVVLYTVLGILVLAAAIFVPVYFMVLADDDEPAPQPNPIAEPGGTPAAGGAGTSTAEARPEKVVVVLNGTPVDGLASGERDKLIEAGYSDEQGMIRIDNNQDQQCQDSIVYYSAEERRQARDVSRLLDITRTEQIDEETQALADSSDQSGTLPANVVALLCADKSP